MPHTQKSTRTRQHAMRHDDKWTNTDEHGHSPRTHGDNRAQTIPPLPIPFRTKRKRTHTRRFHLPG